MKTDFLAPADLRIVGSRVSIAGAGQFSLKAMGTGKLPDGALVYVQSVKAYFQLNRGSTSTPDDISVVAAAFGSGNWHRRSSDFVGESPWTQQDTWYIDADNGFDENDGATAATALATHAEFERRMGENSLITQPVLVTLLTSIEEVIRLRYRLSGEGSHVRWLGTPQSVLSSGSATAFTAPSNGVEGFITDAAADFTSVQGRRIRFVGTGNPQDPKTFIGPLHGGITAARCAQPVYFATPWFALAPQNPVGASYQIEEQASAWGFDLEIDRGDIGAGTLGHEVGAVIEDIDLVGSPSTALLTAKTRTLGATVLLFGCALGSGSFNGPGSVRCVSCSSRESDGTAASPECYDLELRIDYHSGGGWSFLRGTRATMYSANQCDQNPVKLEESGWLFIFELGIYDVAGPLGALDIYSGNTFCSSLFLWGQGNAAEGVVCNSEMQYAILPTITGSTPGVDDVKIAGNTMAWAAVPFIDAATLARVVPSP